MKVFQQNELLAAYAFAKEGGQALHLMAGSFAYLRKDTPACFKGRRQLAHLFDQDRKRLEATARKLGVRKILVERAGDPRRQHIDLCGKPLERALALAATEQQPELMQFQNQRLATPWSEEPPMVTAGGNRGGKSYLAKMAMVDPAELARLREAAAYASFARPILEGLGKDNPLSEL